MLIVMIATDFDTVTVVLAKRLSDGTMSTNTSMRMRSTKWWWTYQERDHLLQGRHHVDQSWAVVEFPQDQAPSKVTLKGWDIDSP